MQPPSENRRATSGGLSTQLPGRLPDADPSETQEWLESLDGVVDHAGRTRARSLPVSVLQRARERQVGVPDLRGTDYIDTIPPGSEPDFPGDEHVERRIRACVRWNAAVMARARTSWSTCKSGVASSAATCRAARYGASR